MPQSVEGAERDAKGKNTALPAVPAALQGGEAVTDNKDRRIEELRKALIAIRDKKTMIELPGGARVSCSPERLAQRAIDDDDAREAGALR